MTEKLLTNKKNGMAMLLLFLAVFGSFGRLFIVKRSVCVRITLFLKSESMYGAMSSGLPHEAFCQVLF